MKLTKKQCIEAVMTEPLMTGRYFEDKNDPNCRVCAMGAILRKAGISNGISSLDVLIELSNYWEDDLNKNMYLQKELIPNLDEKRLALAFFIEAFFPKVINIV